MQFNGTSALPAYRGYFKPFYSGEHLNTFSKYSIIIQYAYKEPA